MQGISPFCRWLRLPNVLLLLASFIRWQAQLEADTVLTNADPVAFQQAVEDGGTVNLAFSGTVKLLSTLTLTTNEADQGMVTLDGGNNVRHFVLSNGVVLRLVGITLANGLHRGADGETNHAGDPGLGGSVFSAGGTVELANCVFTNNQATAGTGGKFIFHLGTDGEKSSQGGQAFGGAIYSTNGSLWATGCTFVGNRLVGGNGGGSDTGYAGPGGDSTGGAVYLVNSTAQFKQTMFTGNVVQAGEMSEGRPAGGGGRSSGGALGGTAETTILTNCVFEGNQAVGATHEWEDSPLDSGAARGGAIFHDGGVLSCAASLFSSNSVVGGWGAARDTLKIASDALGGAVFTQAGRVELLSSGFTFNQARAGSMANLMPFGPDGRGGTAFGGAICGHDSVSIINCTLASNSAVGGDGPWFELSGGGPAYGGGIYMFNGETLLTNVTIAGNSVTAGASGPTGVSLSLATGSAIAVKEGAITVKNAILSSSAQQTNVFGAVNDAGNNICSDSSANLTSPTSRNNLDPLLAPLAYNVGPTPTMPLLPNSPAIDAGDDSVCPPTDQRGVDRPKGLACDIGAFELTPTLSMEFGDQGKTRVLYHFRAGQTNLVSISPDFKWQLLGTRVTDTNGTCELEQVDPAALPIRFYKIEGAPLR